MDKKAQRIVTNKPLVLAFCPTNPQIFSAIPDEHPLKSDEDVVVFLGAHLVCSH